jgi:hypothetical protein
MIRRLVQYEEIRRIHQHPRNHQSRLLPSG